MQKLAKKSFFSDRGASVPFFLAIIYPLKGREKSESELLTWRRAPKWGLDRRGEAYFALCYPIPQLIYE